MSRISAKTFIILWDEVRGWTSDHKFAEMIGIEPSTVTYWRKGRTKSVNPEIIGIIEKKLNCRIKLTADNRWDVRYFEDIPKTFPNIAISEDDGRADK